LTPVQLLRILFATETQPKEEEILKYSNYDEEKMKQEPPTIPHLVNSLNSPVVL
jgi:hypothetical protein